MRSRPIGFKCRYIVVADEDRVTLNFVIETLINDGHAVFQAYDGLRAVQLAVGLKVCDLVISNTRVGGLPGPDLIAELRDYLPDLAILYLAHPDHSTPEIEGELPANVPILREPFTADDLRAMVGRLLNRRRRQPRRSSGT